MTRHMNAKQRAEFNAMFLKMEKELRNKSYQRPVSKQVSAARDFVDALALAKHADCACVCVHSVWHRFGANDVGSSVFKSGMQTSSTGFEPGNLDTAGLLAQRALLRQRPPCRLSSSHLAPQGHAWSHQGPPPALAQSCRTKSGRRVKSQTNFSRGVSSSTGSKRRRILSSLLHAREGKPCWRQCT